MLLRWLNFLKDRKIILASGSKQRINLLKEMGLVFESKTSDFPENLEKTNPKDYVEKTSFKKFEEFLKHSKDLEIDILITADTIVEHEGKILEKPENKSDIYEWFEEYSKGMVICHTSVVIAIINNQNKSENLDKKEILNSIQFTNSTEVYFDEITKEMVSDYIETGEPFNKAGGFAIQGLGRVFIKKINGCYYNVVGFPIQEFAVRFTKLLEETYGKI